jgi:hypothetical protein
MPMNFDMGVPEQIPSEFQGITLVLLNFTKIHRTVQSQYYSTIMWSIIYVNLIIMAAIV